MLNRLYVSGLENDYLQHFSDCQIVNHREDGTNRDEMMSSFLQLMRSQRERRSRREKKHSFATTA